jgi:hypothetical protein
MAVAGKNRNSRGLRTDHRIKSEATKAPWDGGVAEAVGGTPTGGAEGYADSDIICGCELSEHNYASKGTS